MSYGAVLLAIDMPSVFGPVLPGARLSSKAVTDVFADDLCAGCSAEGQLPACQLRGRQLCYLVLSVDLSQ